MRGMPIYLDDDRSLVDPIEIDVPKDAWTPGNAAAQKLFRCVESLRDLDELLNGLSDTKNATKRRRRLKVLLTPLHSLATQIDDLINNCIGYRDTRSKLSDDDAAVIVRLRQMLFDGVPFRRPGLLAILRNKTAAHVDRQLSTHEIHRLLVTLQPHQVGLWIDISISILCDLLKLPIYFWSCHCDYPDVIRIMSAEPFLVSFKLKDGEISELVGTHMAKRSPRADIADLIFAVVKNSRWMFRKADPQIKEFYYDQKGSSWAQSIANWRYMCPTSTVMDPAAKNA